MRILISDVTLTDKHVEVPDRCPGCGIDFHKPGNLVEYSLVNEYEHVRLGPAGVEQPDSLDTERGDSFASPTGYACSQCKWEATPGHEDAGVGRIDPTLEE